MGAAVTIATPLGPLEIAVEVDGASADSPPRRSRLEGGAEVVVWSDVGGLVVDALVTPVAPFVWAPMDLPETHMRGVEWRLYAAVDTTALTISAVLADEVVPSWMSGDEDLVTAEFLTADWMLAMGGPDEESLARLAGEGRQPTSWRDLRMPRRTRRAVEDSCGAYPGSAPARRGERMSRSPGVEAVTPTATTRRGSPSTHPHPPSGQPRAWHHRTSNDEQREGPDARRPARQRVRTRPRLPRPLSDAPGLPGTSRSRR